MEKSKLKFYCDCSESSRALGMEVSEKKTQHVFTLTKIDKDEVCIYCGYYAMANSPAIYPGKLCNQLLNKEK